MWARTCGDAQDLPKPGLPYVLPGLVLTGKAGARSTWGLGRGPGVWGRLATAAVLADPQRSRGGAPGPRTLSGRASPASRVPMLDLWGIPVRVLVLRLTVRSPEGQIAAYMRRES